MPSVVWVTWTWTIWDTFYERLRNHHKDRERHGGSLKTGVASFYFNIMFSHPWLDHMSSPQGGPILEWAWELVCLTSILAVWLWVSDLKNCTSVSLTVKWDSWWHFFHGLVNMGVIVHVVGKMLAPNILCIGFISFLKIDRQMDRQTPAFSSDRCWTHHWKRREAVNIGEKQEPKGGLGRTWVRGWMELGSNSRFTS